jgi:hypothetical protein
MIKILLSAVALAAVLAGMSAPVRAATLVTVDPPPPRQEVVPPPRYGWRWMPGYWHWTGHRHEWVAGSWVREGADWHYAEPRWVEHEGRWVFEPGHWAHGDRDRDGVPDLVEQHPTDARHP